MTTVLVLSSKAMAPNGQASKHQPQPVQRTLSSLMVSVASSRLRAFLGQALMQGVFRQNRQATTSIRVGVAWSTLIRDNSRSNLPSFAAEQANSQIRQPVHLSLSHCMWRRSMPVSFQHFQDIIHTQT